MTWIVWPYIVYTVISTANLGYSKHGVELPWLQVRAMFRNDCIMITDDHVMIPITTCITEVILLKLQPPVVVS